jgi:hypothetical protein
MATSTFSVPISTFYDVKSALFNDANILKSVDELPEQVVNISSMINTYLSAIIPDIENEIKNIVKFNAVNWRERKNPKLLEKFVNTDANIAIFNREINKISAVNYSQMMHNINNIIMDDENLDKMDEYIKYIFHHIFQKCLNEELFSVDYIKFIVAFTEPVAVKLKSIIYENIINILKLIEIPHISDSVLDAVYNGNYATATNISPRIKTYGMILGHYFNNMDSIKKIGIFTDEIVVSSINNFIRNIKSGKHYANSGCRLNAVLLLLGFCDSGLEKYVNLIMSDTDTNIYTTLSERVSIVKELNDALVNIGKTMEIPSKIRFKALDINDNIFKLTVLNTPEIRALLQPSSSATSAGSSSASGSGSSASTSTNTSTNSTTNYNSRQSQSQVTGTNKSYPVPITNSTKLYQIPTNRSTNYEPTIKIGGKQLVNKSFNSHISSHNNTDADSNSVNNNHGNYQRSKNVLFAPTRDTVAENGAVGDDVEADNANTNTNNTNNTNTNKFVSHQRKTNAWSTKSSSKSTPGEWNTVTSNKPNKSPTTQMQNSPNGSNVSSTSTTPPSTPIEDKKPVIDYVSTDYVSINDINDTIDEDLDYTVICRKKKTTQSSPKNLSKRGSKY